MMVRSTIIDEQTNHFARCSIGWEQVQSTRTKVRPKSQIGQIILLLELLVGALALDLVAIAACAQAGLVDWQWLARAMPSPWTYVLSPWLGPKMVRLLAGEGAAFLLLGGLRATFARAIVRGLIGNGTVVMVRRAIGFAWLPILVAADLLLHLDRRTFLTAFSFHGESVVLTLPTLVATIILGLAALAARPRPTRRYLGRPFSLLTNVAPVVVGIGMVITLERALISPASRAGGYLTDALIVQTTLVATEVAFVLIGAEAFLADLADVRSTWGRRGAASLAARGWSLVRLVARACGFLVPVGVGVWLALGATLPSATTILDRHGQVLDYYNPHSIFRLGVPPSGISPAMYLAIDSVEDPGVYASPATHAPINPVRVAGIFTEVTRSVETGEGSLSGGSGIATQSCKNFVGRPVVALVWELPDWVPGRGYLAAAATLAQKAIYEFPCGWAFERAAMPLGLDRSPVTFYLNEVYFGQGAYGVQAASLTYFGKSAQDLTVADAALLAGLPRAPGYLDPWLRPAAVKQRRHEVLASMVREGYLSPGQAAAIDSASLGVLPRPNRPSPRTTQFVEYLMSWLDGHGYHDLSTSGFRITTSLDPTEQRNLTGDVEHAVQALRNREVNNGSSLEIDPRTGEILAWVGGVSSDGTPYYGIDMVSQFPHQPGSTIKPLLYSCALEHGVLRPGELLDDDQRVIGGLYVANWDLGSHGWQPAAEELSQSRNTAAAELTRRLTPDGFATCLSNTFGVTSNLEPARHGVKLGIGLADMPMPELAAAYTALANGGVYQPLTPVLRIQGPDGADLYRFQPGPGRRVIGCATSTWVTRALEAISQKLDLPAGVATKTGTTPSSAYAVGYAPDVILAAWVGRTESGHGPLSIDDVFGREGGGAVWHSVANRRYATSSPPPFASCLAA